MYKIYSKYVKHYIAGARQRKRVETQVSYGVRIKSRYS